MEYHLSNISLVCPVGGFIPHATLTIRDGAITACGEVAAADEIAIDAGGALCLPGLVNSHAHSPLMCVRGMVEDLGFAPAYTPGVPQGHWLSQEETEILALLGVMEMLCAGATTIVDYYRMPGALARAADLLGVRAMVGGRIMDADTAELANGNFVQDQKLGEATFNDALALIEDWTAKDHPKISTILAPHAPDTCSRELLARVKDVASQTGCQVHTHLAQSKLEVEQVKSREGCTPTELLDDVGLLNADLVAAHCIFLEGSDITRLGKARSVVAHAPIGNASFGAAAPIVSLHEAGAQITLCTDTKSADMFEAMRMAIASARWRSNMGFDLEARTVFGWATQDAASALSGHGATGTLEVRSPADLILLDPLAPNLRPAIDGFGIVAHSGSGSNVTDVMVSGDWIVRDRKPTKIDMASVVAEAQKVAEGLWMRARR